MKKPLLVVVTGSVASGKTTLAHVLAHKINCPLISRDELKEGFVNTLGVAHVELDWSNDLHVYNTFFETIEFLISKGISIIVEAAFQDKLWRPKLLPLLDKAQMKIIICNTNPRLIETRFTQRYSNNPERERFHGDQSLRLSREQFSALIENYKAVRMNAPTLQVDTTENYDPEIEEIVSFIRQETGPKN